MALRDINKKFAIAFLLLITAKAWAQDSTGADVDNKAIIANLQKLYPGLKISKINSTPSEQLQELVFEGGQSVYWLKGSDLILQGSLLKVSDTGLSNITELAKNEKRKAALESSDTNDMIVFAAANKAKAVLTVFTDTDCGYCRKLHQEVPELNAKGVEVRYLAYPRGGVGSPTFNDLSSAWCSKNKNEALNNLKLGKDIPLAQCDNNPVAAHYQLGNSLGVSATPAIVLPNGELVMGYRKAADWIKTLGI